jgi:hypothetical protein
VVLPAEVRELGLDEHFVALRGSVRDAVGESQTDALFVVVPRLVGGIDATEPGGKRTGDERHVHWGVTTCIGDSLKCVVRDGYTCKHSRTPACLTSRTERGHMATTTAPKTRESHKKLKPKPKTESKSWQTRNMARKEKQTAHAATLAAKAEP